MANNVNNGITGVIDIPGALRSRGAADGNLVGGVVAYAGDIYDATLDKNLAEVNSDLTEAIGDVNNSISSIQDDISPLTGSFSLQSLAKYNGLEVYEGGRGKNNKVYINDKNLAMGFGYNNTISNTRKLAFGFGQQLDVPDSTFVIGQRNSYEPNAAFIVGNGTLDGSTNNAFVIGRDGNFWVYGINGYAGQLTGASQYNSVNHFLTGLDTRLTALEGSSSSGGGSSNNVTAENVAYDSSETYTSGTVGYAIKQLLTNGGGGSSSYSSLSDKPIAQRSGEGGWVFGNPTDSGCPHAYDNYSFAEGYQTTAGDSRDDYDGYAAHAEGDRTTAKAQGSHSEGILTEASGSAAHVEGFYSVAEGADSHAEGDHAHTAFRAVASHAEGSHTQTTNQSEHASGEYNKSNQTITSGGIIVQDGTLFSVGVGSDDLNRANAFEIFTNGQIYIKGVGNYDGTNAGESGVLSLQDILSSLGFGNTGGSSGSDPYGSDPYGGGY